ncbi:unnamed protein product [Sphagnum troendelagicum]|uniref:Calcineurin-like phosphoesterase domain-containing protein n=1 Tax=Sphagnum troendelagicum TaxID=128251 RepID=A0ABP0UPQ4_9BRYO
MAVVLRRCLSSWYLLLSRESVQHRNSYSLGSLRAPPAYRKLSSCSCFSSTSRSLAHKLHHLHCSTTNPSFSDFSSLPAFPAATQIKAVDVGRDVWAEVETWVVFSDLHLSRRTCDICMEVLQTVYEEAVAQKAGIIFLGDFWHSRGALPVELLNMAILKLQTWKCPAIFIPGNHDQVNVGGEVHALQVLEAANPLIKVLSSPVEYLGALWLPFRRDHNLIKEAVQQSGSIKAIFGHLDVVGAFLNEACQAKEGIEASIFPTRLPVYTGHYHKAHVVEGTQIEYIGSPYQVSAGESEQTKHFLVLNRHWQKIGEIPVNIGPRHFSIVQTEESSHEIVKCARAGDRIRWHVSSNTFDDSVKSQLEELQTRGVLVDLVFPIVTFRQRIKEAEHLDAYGLFELYAKSVEMSKDVTRMATDILHSLDLPAKLIQRRQVDCKLESVEIEAFGAFLGPVKYPLTDRGVRIVSGKNLDSMGADSNGAGKSTLVMAPLWALTGSTDVRPDSVRGLTASEVVHHSAKQARVRVDGTINGKSFTVERRAGRRSGLKFILDGEDQTCQEIRMTQNRLNELIDTSVLYRTVFHGQHGGGGLLEASDKEFKEELSKFMAMEVWAAAKEHSAKALRNKRTDVEHLEGALQQLAEQHQHLKMKMTEHKQQSQEWDTLRGEQVTKCEAELYSEEQKLHGAMADCAHLYGQVASAVSIWGLLGKELQQTLEDGMDSSWPGLDQQAAGSSKKADAQLFETLLQKQTELSHKVSSAKSMTTKTKAMLDDFQKNVAGSQVCDKCLQPIDAAHLSQSLLKLQADYDLAQKEHQLLSKEHQLSELEVKHERTVMERRTAELEEAQALFKSMSVKLLAQLNKVQRYVSAAQVVLNSTAEALLSAPETAAFLSPQQDWSGGVQSLSGISKGFKDYTPETDFASMERDFLYLIQQLESKLNSGKSWRKKVELLRSKCNEVKNRKNPYEPEYEVISRLYAKAESDILEKESRLCLSRQETEWLKEIDTSFGLTGVQSYILEGALADVQERTARYLEMLSGGSLGLLLRPTKLTKSSKVSVEAIDKIAVVRLSNGTLENRSLRQLSGGERRRLGLALALGYADFVSQKGGLQCNLLVLDEVLQHLDGEGQARVVMILKGLPQSTVLVVSQAHSLLAGTFDLVDWVIKQHDTATVELAEVYMG